MSKVDAVRFLANLQRLFAPKIVDGQVFTAYIDRNSNEFTIQADNVIYSSPRGITSDSTSQLIDEVNSASRQISTLQNQADTLGNQLRNIAGIQTQISTLSGEIDDSLVDFAWASVQEDISTLRGYIGTLEEQFDALQESYDTLSQEVHGQITSTEYNLS